MVEHLQINLIWLILILGFALIGTIIAFLYYIFVQKPEIQRETQINTKKLLDFLHDPTITRIEVEKIAKTLGIEEFTVRDLLLDFARTESLPGLVVFPDLYYNFQYCKNVIQSLAEKHQTTELPLKLIAKALNTTKKNVDKILFELITKQELYGKIDTEKDVLILEPTKAVVSHPNCPFCGKEISSSSDKCSECGVTLDKCGVCNLVIGNDESTKCPFCGQPAHTDHLLEWLKLKGTCPHCKHRLTEELLEK